NVVVFATEHNSLYAFNADSVADSGGLLWKINLGVSAAVPNNDFGNRYGPWMELGIEVGITGTPVIDLDSQTLYLDAFTHEGTSYVHRLHALNILDGTERSNSPVVVTASVAGTGIDSSGGQVIFNPKQQQQRSGLLLLGNIVYVCYTSYGDTDPYHGWIIGYDKTSLQQIPNYLFNSTPNIRTPDASRATASEGGIWMGGGAPAVDSVGIVYMATGEG